MGNADPLGGRSGVVDVLPGAAGPLLLDGGTMVIELQGHAHHVITGFFEQGSGDSGVDAAGHGHHNPRPQGQAHSIARRRNCIRGIKALRQS